MKAGYAPSVSIRDDPRFTRLVNEVEALADALEVSPFPVLDEIHTFSRSVY